MAIPGQQYATFTASVNDKQIRASDAALGVTGDADVHAYLIWGSASGTQEIANNWRFGQTPAWEFAIINGNLEFWTSGPGGGDTFAVSTVDLDTVFTVGDWIFIRAHFDASATDVLFYWKANVGDGWTQLGSTVAVNQTGLASGAPDTMDVHRDIAGDVESTMAWVELYNDEATTLVGKCDFADAITIDASWTGAEDGLTWAPNSTTGWLLTRPSSPVALPSSRRTFMKGFSLR